MKSKDVVILDTRKSSIYCAEHIPKSIFIGLDGRFAPWVGEIIKDIYQEIILIVKKERVQEAITRLSRVGFDNCIGYLDADLMSWKSAGYSTESVRSISPKQFIKESHQNSQIIDVREKPELSKGKFQSSINVPLSKIDSSIKFDKNVNSYVYCSGGYRSVIACSLIKKNGLKKIVNVEKGFNEIRNLI